MPTNVNLYGIQTLFPTVDNDFYLIYDPNQSTRPENNAEVYIIVDTSFQVAPASVNIYLPSISNWGGIYNTQIFVYDKNGTAAANPINIIAGGGDNIDGSPVLKIANDNGSCQLLICATNSWTTGGGGSGESLIVITYAQAQLLMIGNSVQVGGLYYITDANDTDLGIIVSGISSNQFANTASGGYYVPPYTTTSPDWSGVLASSGIAFVSYRGTWNIAAGDYLTGQVVTYDGFNWISVDNTNAPIPVPLPFSSAGDATRPFVGSAKWTRLPKQTNCGYFVEWDILSYVVNKNTIGTFISRADKRFNIIYGSSNNTFFKWGNDGVREIFCNATCTINNRNDHNGTGGNANQLRIWMTNDSTLTANEIDSNLFRITMDNASILNTQYAQVNRCIMSSASSISSLRGINTALRVRIGDYNYMEASSISGFTRTANALQEFKFNNMFDTQLANLVLDNSVSPLTGFNTQQIGGNTWSKLQINFQSNVSLVLRPGWYQPNNFEYNNLTFSSAFNQLHGFLDMNTAFNAGTGTLTLPAGYAGFGEIWLYNTAGQTIQIVSGLNVGTNYRNGMKFRIFDGTGVTFQVIARAAFTPPPAAANGIVGAGNVVLHSPIYSQEYAEIALLGGIPYIQNGLSFI